MKNLIITIFVSSILLAICQRTSAQETEDVNNSCVKALNIQCNLRKNPLVIKSPNNVSNLPQAQFSKLSFSSAGSLTIGADGHTGTYTLYGPFNDLTNLLSKCHLISMGLVESVSNTYTNSITINHQVGSYILKMEFDQYRFSTNYDNFLEYQLYSENLEECNYKDTTDCKDCLKTFSPTPGQYVLSVWTRGEVANKNKTYLNPVVSIGFNNGIKTDYLASGNIIDDWQRIDVLLTVPATAVTMQIELGCKSGTCLFDDFRFYPVDASMISYAFDPITLRLVAQLDERNYATFYEYDEEGQLIRVKKETERGIMTIQENSINITK